MSPRKRVFENNVGKSDTPSKQCYSSKESIALNSLPQNLEFLCPKERGLLETMWEKAIVLAHSNFNLSTVFYPLKKKYYCSYT